jgi:hypothetical protein
MFKIYFVGVFILFIAILLNGLINKMGIASWYDFLNKMMRPHKEEFRNLNYIDYCWLFLAYPLLLGVAAWTGNWLYTFIENKI